MIRMSLHEAAKLADGRLRGPDVEFSGVSTDSRDVAPGGLFAALKGERSDGHDFVTQAMAAGAAGALVDRPVEVACPQLIVADVVVAMGVLAGAWRAGMDVTVVAVTGSNGKTTVKEMLASILGQNRCILATEGNFNNEQGVPLTLFRLDPAHRYAVLELGASRQGDIEYLAKMTRPKVGVVNNAAAAHLEGFTTIEGVARSKGELFEALGSDGTAVINGDQRWSGLWREQAGAARQVTFGTHPDNDFRVEMTEEGLLRIHTPAGDTLVRLPLQGEHNAMNAIAATAAAAALGTTLDEIRSGLEAVRPVPGRFHRQIVEAGWELIDDTYNANPASLYAALQVLSEEPGEAWLVLGDMAELGPGSRKLHAEMGEAAAHMGIRRLFCVGPLSAATAESFGRGARHFDDRAELVAAVLENISPGISCLVKGSRSMGMENVVAALIAGQDTGGAA